MTMMMNFHPGDRIHLIDHKTGYQYYGCILEIDIEEKGKSLHLVVDEPMNQSPSSKEIDYSKKYKLLSNYFLIIHSSNIQHYTVTLSNQNIFEASYESYFKCRCGHIGLKSSMFICQCGSYQCWRHLIPWNEDNNAPDMSIVSSFAEYLLTHFPDASYISSRALLYYHKWKNAEGMEDQNKIALMSLQEDGMNCSHCGVDTSVFCIDEMLFSDHHHITAIPHSRLTPLPHESVVVHLIDRDKYRYEDLQQNLLLSLSYSDGGCNLNSLSGSVSAISGAVLSEIDVAVQLNWNFAIFRAVLLCSLFEDYPINSDHFDLAMISPKYFRGSEWDDYNIYLIENDVLEKNNDDLVVGGWKWVTHLIDNNRTIDASKGRDSDSGVVAVHQLLENDLLTIRSNRDNVGPPSRISVLCAEYAGNANLQMKTKELNLYYSGWRKIRGDGNCYFRAIIYGFIESVIAATFDGMTSCISMDENSFEMKQAAMMIRRDSFGHLLQLLQSVSPYYQYDHEIEAHQRLMWAVKLACDGERWISLTEFENDILNPYTRLDQSIVRAIRQSAAAYIISHQADDVNGISLKDAILPSYPNCRSLDIYCEEYVTRMGVDAEGPLVDIGILFSLLKSKGTLVMFDRRDEVELSIKNFPCVTKVLPNPLANIHLLYRPGHYDLLYPLSTSDGPFPLSEHVSQDPDPIDIRTVSVSCIYPALLNENGFLPIFETTYEVVDNDFLVLGATRQNCCRSSTTSKHPLLQNETFRVYKYDEENMPSMLEQTINLSRSKFSIPDSRPIKFIPAMDFSLDYLYPEEWKDYRDGKQMIAVVDHISTCQISILGITKFEDCYLPINRYSEIASYIEIFGVIDCALDGLLACEFPSAQLLLKPISRFLKLNCSKYVLSASETDAERKNEIPRLISCELCVNINVEIRGTNENQNVVVPLHLFSSIEEFALFMRKKFNIAPQCCVQFSVVSHSSEIVILWNGEELFNQCLRNGAEIPHLFLKYCEVPEEGIACETISGLSQTSEICLVSSCGHHACHLCLLRHLVHFSNDRAFQEDYRLWDSAVYLDSTKPHVLLSHLFEPADLNSKSVDGVEGIPILRKIPCPVLDCEAHLSEIDLNSLPEFQQAYATAISKTLSRQTCSLYSILNCDSRPSDLDRMVCLGCSHFYHPECFLHYLTAEIQNSNHNDHIVCIQCRMSSSSCHCLECFHRLDKSSTGEHIINETDMKMFHQLILNSKLKNITPQEQAEVTLDIEKLIRRWLDLYTNKSLSMISELNGNKLFACECGHRYEIEGSIGSGSTSQESKEGERRTSFICPNPACRKTYCTKCHWRYHPSMTCHEASIERTLELIRAVSIDDTSTSPPTSTLAYLGGLAMSLILGTKSPHSIRSSTKSGINIQHCPNCDAAYGVPINCFHAICESEIGGCGTEFCFLCAAIRSPILAHGNMMHRKSCPYNLDQYCCSHGCLRNGEKKCVELQWSQHCTECQKNNDGEVCSFPTDTNEPGSGKHWKVLNLADVKHEIEIIQNKQQG